MLRKTTTQLSYWKEISSALPSACSTHFLPDLVSFSSQETDPPPSPSRHDPFCLWTMRARDDKTPCACACDRRLLTDFLCGLVKYSWVGETWYIFSWAQDGELSPCRISISLKCAPLAVHKLMFPSVTCEPEGTFTAWLHFIGELIGSDLYNNLASWQKLNRCFQFHWN